MTAIVGGVNIACFAVTGVICVDVNGCQELAYFVQRFEIPKLYVNWTFEVLALQPTGLGFVSATGSIANNVAYLLLGGEVQVPEVFMIEPGKEEE